MNPLVLSLLYGPALTSVRDYWKNHTDLCQQRDESAFSALSGFVIAFLPRSKLLLISWLQSPFAWPDIATATAKSLQSCLTLGDPMDCSLPGSSVHGIFQARVLEWGAIAFSIAWPSHLQKPPS